MNETQDQLSARQERVSRVAAPPLDELAEKLEALTSEIFATRVPFEPDNGADVMALTFATKQREHLRAVRTLIAAGQQRDALLIARTMVEGMACLLWAFKKPSDRTDLWFWFGAILDWRQTLKNEADVLVVDPGDKARLKTMVDEHGHRYFTKNAREALESAERNGMDFDQPDDPWEYKWTKVTIGKMFRDVQGDAMYVGAYHRSSEWIHWGPRSLLSAMEPADWGINGFSQEDWRTAVEALQLGCQSLLQSLEVLDRHFSLGKTERLIELNTSMVTMLTDALETGG